MANTIASAERYFNNDAELAKIFQATSYTSDWEKPNVAIGAQTVKYRQVKLSVTDPGDYNRETGYEAADITVSWVEKKLTQDKGNSLHLDKMDSEETQSLELVTVGKTYLNDVLIPAIDKYRFKAVVDTAGIQSKEETLTADTIEGAIDAGIDYLSSIGAVTDLVLHINISSARFLKNALKKQGNLPIGQFNGDATVPIFYYGDNVRVKIVEVPDALLGDSVNFILAPKAAVAAMEKYRDNAFFDRIPNYGSRMAQLDLGIYHDCWVEPGAEKAVYVSKEEAI